MMFLILFYYSFYYFVLGFTRGTDFDIYISTEIDGSLDTAVGYMGRRGGG